MEGSNLCCWSSTGCVKTNGQVRQWQRARTAVGPALARMPVGGLQHEQRLHEHVRGRLAHELAHKALQVLQAAAGLAAVLLRARG